MVTTSFFNVVNSREHSFAAISQNRQFFGQFLLINHHWPRHFDENFGQKFKKFYQKCQKTVFLGVGFCFDYEKMDRKLTPSQEISDLKYWILRQKLAKNWLKIGQKSAKFKIWKIWLLEIDQNSNYDHFWRPEIHENWNGFSNFGQNYNFEFLTPQKCPKNGFLNIWILQNQKLASNFGKFETKMAKVGQ